MISMDCSVLQTSCVSPLHLWDDPIRSVVLLFSHYYWGNVGTEKLYILSGFASLWKLEFEPLRLYSQSLHLHIWEGCILETITALNPLWNFTNRNRLWLFYIWFCQQIWSKIKRTIYNLRKPLGEGTIQIWLFSFTWTGCLTLSLHKTWGLQD